MAETSGFFEADWDESLINPETGEQGDWNKKYFAHQFAKYFSLFIKNGVFGSPTNQLKVRAGEGMTVILSEGYAFINGYWYYNDSDKIITLPTNGTSSSRADSVRIRLNMSTGEIQSLYFASDIDNIRNDNYWDLKVAEVVIPALAVSVLDSYITDTRANENVCGFVTNLLKVQETNDLFSQYDSIFNQWFDLVKGQLTEDMAYNIQNQIGIIENLTTEEKSNLVSAINEVANILNSQKESLEEVEKSIGDINNLQTIVKDSLVNAINELNNKTKIATNSSVGMSKPDNETILIDSDGTLKSKYKFEFVNIEPTEVEQNTIVFVYEE